MARDFSLGNDKPQSGNRVSHSHIKTRHQWLPNVQAKALYSNLMARSYRVKISPRHLRSVDKAGGLDNYLLAADSSTLSREMRKLRKVLVQRAESAA